MVLQRLRAWGEKSSAAKTIQPVDPLAGTPAMSALKSYYYGSLRGLDSQSRDIMRTKRGMGLAMAVNIPAFRCVRVLGNTIGGLVYRMIDIETEEAVCQSTDPRPEHPMIRAMQNQYRRTGQAFFSLWSQSLSVAGECFLEPLPNPMFNIYSGVEWLNPLAVEVNAPMGKIESFFYSGEQGQKTLYPSQIVYDRTLNLLDDARGLSPLEVAISTVNIDRDTQRALIAWFRNNALPPVIFSPKEGQMISPLQWDDIRKQLDSQHKGVDNFFRTLVSPVPLNVATVDMPDVDKNVELMKHMEQQVYVAFGVPPAVAGDTSSTPYKEERETKRDFFTLSLGPQARQIERAVNSLLLPYYDDTGRYRFEFDTSEFEAERIEEQQKTVDLNSKLYHDSSITVQTYRSRIGLEDDGASESWDALPEMVYLPAINAPIPLAELPSYWQWQKASTALELYNKGGITLNDMLEMTGKPKVEHGDVYSVSANTVNVPADQMGVLQPKQTFLPGQENGGGSEQVTTGGASETPEAIPFDASQRLSVKALALDELAAWQKVIKNKTRKASDFVCRYLRADIETFVKDKLASDTPYSGLFAEARAMLEVKAIQATRLDFEGVVEDMVQAARAETISRAKFTADLRSEIGRFMRLAYRDGLIDGGVSDGEPDADEEEQLKALIQEKTALAKSLSEQVFVRGLSDAEALSKPEMWYKGTAGIAYSAALVSAGENSNYEFAGDDGEENCETCKALKGQVHRLRIWDSHNLNLTGGAFPEQATICKGYLCKHILVATDRRAYGRIPALKAIYKYADPHKAGFVESEHPREATGQFTSSGGGGGEEGGQPTERTPSRGVAESDAQVRRIEQDDLDDVNRVLGDKYSPSQIASLGGMSELPPGQEVRISQRGGEVRIATGDPARENDVRMVRKIKKDENGDLVCRNESFFLPESKQGGGRGTEMFNNQVENLRAAGVKRVTTQAIRTEDTNGYYTWARLGYDADLPTNTRMRLGDNPLVPGPVRNATRVSDLMKTSEGRDWWRNNGETIEMSFDLDKNSLSSRILAEYIQRRKDRRNG